MTDPNRDGIRTLHPNSDTPANLDSNSGSRDITRSNSLQKRTRSQQNVSDSILRLPLSRSPLKDARKAHAKAWSTPAVDPQLHTPGASQGRRVMVRANGASEAGTLEVGRNLSTCADMSIRQHMEESGSRDNLLSFARRGREAYGQDSGQHVTTKKRISPDPDAMRAPSSPGHEHQSKRAKLEAFRILDRRQDNLEYLEPLRDRDGSTPSWSKSQRRMSSTTQARSPSKVAPSIFPCRAQSVPLGGENEVPAVDLITIPLSPRRSPSKGGVEVRRALSVPPDDNQMEVDAEDDSGLVHFTNSTRFSTPRAHPASYYTVNFATPATPPRSGNGSPLPLSPLTPLPPSLSVGHLPRIQGPLAKTKVDSLVLSDSTPSSCSIADWPTADITVSMDVPHLDIHLSSYPFSASRQATFASSSVDASQPRPVRHSLTSGDSAKLISPSVVTGGNSSATVAPMARGSGRAHVVSSRGTHSTEEVLTDTSELSSPLSSPPDSTTTLPVSLPTITGSLKSKQGPLVVPGPRRVTRSVSMRAEKVYGGIDDIVGNSDPTEVTAVISSKPPPPKSTGSVPLKPKPSRTALRPASVSKRPPDLSKLKQTSLAPFMRAKPRDDSTTCTSMSTGSLSRIDPPSSPSKISLPTSPSKLPPVAQSSGPKSFFFSLGSTSTGAGTGIARGASGHSLRTLSHALDKLVVPPPSRPNTSMGFVREDGESKEGTWEHSKGKEKTKDDASAPFTSRTRRPGATFARPTASSLNRAATVTGFGSTTMTGTRGRGLPTVRGIGKGRDTAGIWGRAGDRASRKTSLPVVMGSPVKGLGSPENLGSDGSGDGRHQSATAVDGGDTANEDRVLVSPSAKQDKAASIGAGRESATAQKLAPLAVGCANNGVDINLTTPISVDKGKQRALSSSTLNPASSALHALSESLSSLPQTPTLPKPRAVSMRTGLRSSTASTSKGSPTLYGSGGAAPSGSNEVHDSDTAGPSSGPVDAPGGTKKPSLKILKQCIIFVDVRTEQGDDAGSLFVDMLRGLGAKITSRLSPRCTHIVYKNGLANTLTRYRMLNDPKPAVVGIAWVVECAEKRAKLDEERFKIDVDLINVVGGNDKRRRSMLPKHLIPTSPGPNNELSMHMSSEADGDDSMGDMGGSPFQDPDLSIQSREDDDLPPLERARRRKSVLPGGQTRLVL